MQKITNRMFLGVRKFSWAKSCNFLWTHQRARQPGMFILKYDKPLGRAGTWSLSPAAENRWKIGPWEWVKANSWVGASVQLRIWGAQAYASPHSLACPLHGSSLEACEKDPGQGMTCGRLNSAPDTSLTGCKDLSHGEEPHAPSNPRDPGGTLSVGQLKARCCERGQDPLTAPCTSRYYQ